LDEFLDINSVYERLKEEYLKYNKLIIAYDFDNTIFDYHEKGYDYEKVIALLKRWKGKAYEVCFTCRGKDHYDFIYDYTKSRGIPCDGINENVGHPGYGSGKIFYNILLDDRAGLYTAYHALLKLTNEIENGKIKKELTK
jgi:hypothetical protein